jgi:hypothetical protein
MSRLASVMAFASVLSLAPLASQADGPFQYHPITPCRAVDTRFGNGGILAAQGDRTFAVQGVCGVPTGAKAVSLNVTVVGTNGGGFLTLYPSNVAKPSVSTINFLQGDTVANGAILPLGTTNGADLRIYAGTTGSVNVILDVNGYFE